MNATEFCTAFRDTATMPDASGRYRTSIILATRLYGEWSDEAKASQCRSNPRPMKALRLTVAEFEALEADSSLRFGYVDTAGDVETPFTPEPWNNAI